MDYIYAFIAGLLCKLYDDLDDNNLIKHDFIKEALKGSQWILLTLLSYNDFNFSLLNYLINGLNAINNWKEWIHPYETALLIVTPIFMLLSFSTITMITFYDIIFIMIFILCMSLEPIFITEEYSYRKLFIRICVTFCSLIGIFAGQYFGVSSSYVKISFYAIGYFLVSSCFQLYLLRTGLMSSIGNIITDLQMRHLVV